MSALWSAAVEREAAPGQPPPGRRHHGDADRQAHHHPLGEAQVDATILGQVTRQQGIGRCADQGGHAADAGRVGDGQQQGGGVAAQLLRIAVAEQADHRHADGQHHDRRGGIGDPHAQKAGGEHETGDLTPRLVSHQLQHVQGEAAVQLPALHGDAEQETAQEQVDDRVGVAAGGLAHAAQPQGRHQHHGQQRGGGNRYGLGGPPGGHQQRHAYTGPRRR